MLWLWLFLLYRRGRFRCSCNGETKRVIHREERRTPTGRFRLRWSFGHSCIGSRWGGLFRFYFFLWFRRDLNSNRLARKHHSPHHLQLVPVVLLHLLMETAFAVSVVRYYYLCWIVPMTLIQWRSHVRMLHCWLDYHLRCYRPSIQAFLNIRSPGFSENSMEQFTDDLVWLADDGSSDRDPTCLNSFATHR